MIENFSNSENISSERISHKELLGLFLADQEGNEMCPFTDIWRAVITQALMDASSNAKKLDAKREKARALAWLNGNSDDFGGMCVLWQGLIRHMLSRNLLKH